MKARYLYTIAVLVACLDQLSKFLVESRLPYGTTFPVLGNTVSLTTVHNRGGAFGVMQSWTVVLTLVTIAVVVAIVIVSKRSTRLPSIVGLALALQLGGALGNLIDRLRFGYVIDFIDLHVWPVFNLADCAITVGILLLAYYLVIGERGRNRVPVTAPQQVTKDS